MAGLLADLRDTPASRTDWDQVRRVVELLVPNAEITKLTVSSGGRVVFRGKASMGHYGRQYLVGQLAGYGERREDGTHQIAMGVAKLRDEADATFYDQPFMGWVEPNPAAVAAWIVGVLMVESPYSPRRVRSGQAWTPASGIDRSDLTGSPHRTSHPVT
jgi:hypothetical protein